MCTIGLLPVATVSVGTFQPRGSGSAHFHPVHVNSTEPAKTQQFYEKTFGRAEFDWAAVMCGER